VTQIDGGREHVVALRSDGTKTNRQSPVQVSGLTGVIAVETGHCYSMALRSDGTVWMWGRSR
jgi:alpha-tubulin suppressor-like RCC1 family protein